jgi:hypothetical protein
MTRFHLCKLEVVLDQSFEVSFYYHIAKIKPNRFLALNWIAALKDNYCIYFPLVNAWEGELF